MRLLIMEDDHVVAALYSRALQEAGFDVEVATDGSRGVDRVMAWRPHGVILDLMLPGKNGMEVLNSVRTDARFERLPTMVLTANFEPKLVTLALDAGATQVYDKAKATPAELVSAFKEIFLRGPNVRTRRSLPTDQGNARRKKSW